MNPSVPQLSPGTPSQMLGEAIEYLKAMARDAAQRADVFESFVSQIEQQAGGTWRAARAKGTDGSDIFLGRQGEALVVAPDGGLYRGAVKRGVGVTGAGLVPDYAVLKALD